MNVIPESKNFSARSKSAAKFWRKCSPQFRPGKSAARKHFRKNPPHIHEGRNKILSQREILGIGGGGTKKKLQGLKPDEVYGRALLNELRRPDFAFDGVTGRVAFDENLVALNQRF